MGNSKSVEMQETETVAVLQVIESPGKCFATVLTPSYDRESAVPGQVQAQLRADSWAQIRDAFCEAADKLISNGYKMDTTRRVVIPGVIILPPAFLATGVVAGITEGAIIWPLILVVVLFVLLGVGGNGAHHYLKHKGTHAFAADLQAIVQQHASACRERGVALTFEERITGFGRNENGKGGTACRWHGSIPVVLPWRSSVSSSAMPPERDGRSLS